MAEETIKVDGVVKELLSNGVYRVELEGGHEVQAHVKGKIAIFKSNKSHLKCAHSTMTRRLPLMFTQHVLIHVDNNI